MAISFRNVLLEITCANPSAFINILIGDKIQLFDIVTFDALTFQVKTTHSDFKRIRCIAEKQGVSVKVIENIGFFWRLELVAKRPVLMFFCTLVLMVGCFLQSRVLFLRVEGNDTVTDRQILEVAQECGIEFGISRRKIRSEKIKNALLESIPQLKWAGINTTGCTAVISVREKTEPETIDQQTKQVTSIVALRDGIIQNCTVYQGNPLCAVGQAVKAGQTLVSGYTDCGITTQATQAKAEIQALTKHQLEIVSPKPQILRGGCLQKKVSYSLRVGKKVIKFTKDTGNSTDLCVKIYTEEYIQLPGNFQLPIAIIKETSYLYDTVSEESVISEAENWLDDYAKEYLEKIMIAGRIISSQTEIYQDDSVRYLRGNFACIEMIGQTRVEQTILGENRND